jgi:hypothetical protein
MAGLIDSTCAHIRFTWKETFTVGSPGLWTQSSYIHHTPPFLSILWQFGPIVLHAPTRAMASSSSRQGARHVASEGGVAAIGGNRESQDGTLAAGMEARHSSGVFNTVALGRQEIDLFGLFLLANG